MVFQDRFDCIFPAPKEQPTYGCKIDYFELQRVHWKGVCYMDANCFFGTIWHNDTAFWGIYCGCKEESTKITLILAFILPAFRMLFFRRFEQSRWYFQFRLWRMHIGHYWLLFTLLKWLSECGSLSGPQSILVFTGLAEDIFEVYLDIVFPVMDGHSSQGSISNSFLIWPPIWVAGEPPWRSRE